jgi:hypothetical protein
MLPENTDRKQILLKEILSGFPVGGLIRNIAIHEVDSPWADRARLVKKSDQFDLKLNIWGKEDFLYGRLYRLVLYLCDALDPAFQYRLEAVPNREPNARAHEIHNQIWSIYVDSRLERRGIENFFDRVLRRNLFIDSQKQLPWAVSNTIFERLWGRETWTHPDIIQWSYDLENLVGIDGGIDEEAFEIQISKSLLNHSALKHVDNIVSNDLRDAARGILGFVQRNCRGTLIESSFYNIYFMYDQEIFVEMVTSKTDALLVTLFDFQSNEHKTYVVDERSKDLDTLQGAIKQLYDKISFHSQLKSIKNPYTAPIEK